MGSKLYFLNSFYRRGNFDKDEITGKSIRTSDDFLFATIKDCDTNETILRYFPTPKIDFYVTKERLKYKYPRMSMPITELNKITCLFRDRERALSKAINCENEYFTALKCKNRYEFVSTYLYNNPNLYLADMDIEDYYKNVFMEKFGRNIFKDYGVLKLGKMDIEVDQHDYNGPQCTGQNPQCPINLITYFDFEENCLYYFILNNQKDNIKMQKIKKDPTEFIAWSKSLAHMEYESKLFFYDTEIELLYEFWKNIHRMKPDFVGIWNMNFDIPYILGRMEQLGMDIVNTCCHPEVPPDFRCVEYIEDSKRKEKVFSKKSVSHPSRFWDWVNITGYTQFYDMMALYSIIRKRSLLPSYKLDAVAETETGYGKLDYTSKGYDIRNLAWQDFEIFLAYGGIDTIRLVQIEKIVGDIQKQILFADNTRLSKSTSISYAIKNAMYRQYLDRNPKEIIGNNVTYPIKEQIEGALVADPTNLRIKGKKLPTGAPTFVYENLCDWDFTSLYPSCIINFQISKSTIHGRIIELYENDIPIGDKDMGINILQLLQTKSTSILEMMSKYFNLPSYDELVKEIENCVNK
jgi:DNA polymerase elongation subunit (family B)